MPDNWKELSKTFSKKCLEYLRENSVDVVVVAVVVVDVMVVVLDATCLNCLDYSICMLTLCSHQVLC